MCVKFAESLLKTMAVYKTLFVSLLIFTLFSDAFICSGCIASTVNGEL